LAQDIERSNFEIGSNIVNWLKHTLPNNRLLLRYYFAIIFGIAAVALALDLFFYPLINNQEAQRSQAALFALASAIAEQHLQAGDGDSQHRVGAYTLVILPAQSVQTDNTQTPTAAYTLASNQQGETYLNWRSRDGLHWVQFGPLPPIENSPNWPTWVFYGSLFVLVSLWLQPLLKDLDRISRAVDDFRNDYRAPLPQLKNSSNLKPLANNIANMADRIRQLIELQKDLGNVLSHEMRTPLSRVKFSLALLRSSNQLNEQQQTELAGIDQDVRELEQLTQAMLNFAKLDHPDMAIERQWLNAHHWISSYVEKQSRHSDTVALLLKIADEDDKTDIFADPYWLELAVSNIVNNAMRYAQSEILITLSVTSGGFSLAVADDGPGINAAETEHVIKPFYQTAGGSKKGFGLGLALVSRIAQLHGGKVNITSSALGGAEVTITGNYPNAKTQPTTARQ